MKDVFYDHILLFAVVVIPILFIIISSLLYLLVKKMKKEKIYKNIVIFCSISIIGYLTGLISGNSRVPVVEVLLPLLFSFIGGLSLFVIARGKNEIKKITAILSAAFIFSTVTGLWIGSINRSMNEKSMRKVEFNNKKQQAEIDLYIYQEKKKIDLIFQHEIDKN